MAIRALAIGVLLVALLGACSSSEPAGLLATIAPTPSATALATELQPTLKPTPKATFSGSKSGSFYKPPGWDGVSDVNCSDFDTHAHAESFFKGTGGSKTSDPYHLDNDHDGNACETLP